VQLDNGEVDVTLIDISTAGAMIKAPTTLAAVGIELKLSIDAIADGLPIRLNLVAVVCHSNRAKDEDAYFMGLAFKGVGPQEKLALHYLTQTPHA
jgi:c-di-GMP-binding flagellar brake protein YcgR